MRIHHINAGTLCPVGAKFVQGPEAGGWGDRARMVCHCLLVESNDGLILVDTGMGTEDLADVDGRLGKMFGSIAAPRRDPSETAIAAVRRMGFAPEDVRHIVPTHLDLDHAGGLPDFPWATVHVFEKEHAAAMARATRRERERYRRVHWAHGPRWDVRDGAEGGDYWKGFRSVRALGGVDDVLLIPLEGHTRGHCGVAVRGERGWVLHAGDAYFHHREMDASPYCPPGLRMFQRLAAIDDRQRRENQQRLRELANSGTGSDVTIHCAHCPVELERVIRS
jgi:glyoxylase-like metal-dependent hydrolase (beta-lactamase superfamily II)